jgi:transposase
MLRVNKIRTVLQASRTETTIRGIAKAARTSRTSVENILKRLAAAGSSPDDALRLSEEELRQIIFPVTDKNETERRRTLNERIPGILKALGRKHMTLQVQWEQYRNDCPDGYAYSRFCDFIRDAGNAKDELYLGMHYNFGELMLVDYAGDVYYWTDPLSGQKVSAELFVAILPASQYTFAVFTPGETTVDWIDGCEGATRYIGGIPKAVVPDCAKALINTARNCDSEINHHFLQFCEHYRMMVAPARPRKPRDKALVENAVNNIYRRVYPRLLLREYHSIAELNNALRPLMEEYNNRTMKLYRCSRKELFEMHEKTHLAALPDQPFEFRGYQAPAKVAFNMHLWLACDSHYYSVPERFVGRKCYALYSSQNLEIYCENIRIALHRRDRSGNTKYTTDKSHLSEKYRQFLEWTPERFLSWAREHGANIEAMTQSFLSNAGHYLHAYRYCMGLLALLKPYGAERLDRACARVLHFGGCSLHKVKAVLETGKDHLPNDEQQELQPLPQEHSNIRYKHHEEKQTA